MLLALDIGNTNIVAGLFNGDTLINTWRLATHRQCTGDEMATFFKSTFELCDMDFSNVDGLVISSVVPSLTPEAEKMAQKYFHCRSLTVSSQTDIGLKNAYDNPREVGADRLVNGIAAWSKYQKTCVIADFGTATTVDAVSKDGTYLGGALAPGIHISANALFDAAAKLPRVERLELLEAPVSVLGKNTMHSVQAGIIFGYAGLVKELVSRCQDELNDREIVTIATGGLAEVIAPLVPQIKHIEPHLTLEGLRIIWQRNL
ncbi:MAG: type III pantothenate kinase [Abditibacteriaceae bacterium]